MLIALLSVCSIRSFSESLVSNSKGPINSLTLNNRSRQARPTLVNINSDENQFTVSVNKRGGCCNTIDDPYARVCVPNKVKKINVKVFNSVPGVNETTYLL